MGGIKKFRSTFSLQRKKKFLWSQEGRGKKGKTFSLFALFKKAPSAAAFFVNISYPPSPRFPALFFYVLLGFLWEDKSCCCRLSTFVYVPPGREEIGKGKTRTDFVRNNSKIWSYICLVFLNWSPLPSKIFNIFNLTWSPNHHYYDNPCLSRTGGFAGGKKVK